ncbi:hypothetical protein A148_03165 [Vibrio splendidus 1F-157]|nr:hypothetical protein A148_03165 [Vibrio splendidus 1F-157]
MNGDGAYNTKACHAAIKIKGAMRLFPPKEKVAFWRSYMAQISIGKNGMDITNFAITLLLNIGLKQQRAMKVRTIYSCRHTAP